jgi:hypothetical protein
LWVTVKLNAALGQSSKRRDKAHHGPSEPAVDFGIAYQLFGNNFHRIGLLINLNPEISKRLNHQLAITRNQGID